MTPIDLTPTPDIEPDLDRSLRALSDRRRRHALRCLADARATSLSCLADEIAEREGETTVVEWLADDTRDLQVGLHHWHLPMLEEVGLVRYRPTDHVVAITDAGAALAGWLEEHFDGSAASTG